MNFSCDDVMQDSIRCVHVESEKVKGIPRNKRLNLVTFQPLKILDLPYYHRQFDIQWTFVVLPV